MKILAIETSCDDTGIAILDVKNNGEFNVLSNVVSSQTIHQNYGGVFPAMAKREHQKNLVPAFVEALKSDKSQRYFDGPVTISPRASLVGEAKLKTLKIILEREQELAKQLIPFLKKYDKPDVDAIAVTNGPGLEPCLWVGVNFAKAISYFWDILIVPVNHVESHILVNFLGNPKFKFPAIALVVSGGHTQIILIEKIGKYKILGETRDDAAGECFDKCAKILGLGYPGGPVIAALAEKAKIQNLKSKIKLPRPMIRTKDYDFSFSGLKTAVLYADMKVKNKTTQYKKEMAAEIQQAIIDVLIKKTMKAARDFKVKTILLGGGVSANKELRKQFSEKVKELISVPDLQMPEPKYCTDNGLMIAIAGYYHQKDKINPSASSGRFLREIEADSNLRISK